MEYKRLPVYMKRYSFFEKMRICSKYSKQCMNINGIQEVEKLLKIPMPWYLETFVLFSVKNKEYSDGNFQEKNQKMFFEMINCIQNYIPPKMEAQKNKIKFLDFLIAGAVLCQADLQEYYFYKYYRYNYMFNFKNSIFDMSTKFTEFFGTSYDNFLFIGLIIRLLYSFNMELTPEVIARFYRDFPNVMYNLTITREEYSKKIDDYANCIEDYLYCIRPSYSYLFIEEKGRIYLPLPHLSDRCITSSLYHRITTDDNLLRSLIGKEILESYLLKIINQSNLFDEILPEQKYLIKKKESKTLDVMIRKDGDYLFLDSKSFVPRTKIRQLDEEVIEEQTTRLAEGVKQIYKHLNTEFPQNYNFFGLKETNIPKENKWGLVVVLEESFIRRELIYEETAKLLKIDCKSTQYLWMVSHIKIVGLYEIEKFVFTGEDILLSLKDQAQQGKNFDYSLINTNDKVSTFTSEFLNFKNELLHKTIKIMTAMNIIKPS